VQRKQIINKIKRHENITESIPENSIPQIKTDPKTKFQKQTQQAIQSVNKLQIKISITSTHKL